MSNIYTSADQLIGKTPLLKLSRIEKEAGLRSTRQLSWPSGPKTRERPSWPCSRTPATATCPPRCLRIEWEPNAPIKRRIL